MKCRTCLADRNESEDFENLAAVHAHRKLAHPGERSPSRRPRADAAAAGGGASVLDLPTPEIAPGSIERAPGAPRPSSGPSRLRDRLRNRKPAADVPGGERRPRTTKGPRVPTAKLFQALWARPGQLLLNSGADPAVGRVLIYQAPRAGEVLERATKGTFIDKAIQPLARRAEDATEVAQLLALPMLVALYERNPTPVVELMMREAMRAHLIAMVPLVKAQRAEEAKYAEMVAEMGLDPGDDPIGAVLSEVFAPPPGVEEEPAEPGAQEREAS